jgi:4-amino-4-deoxy-L-arabinose transferase-like glycosyltransferase
MLTKAHLHKVLPYFPLLLFLLNIGLKLAYLTTAAVGHDEPFSIYHAQFGLGTIVKELAKGNNPPLFEIILHFWIKLFGISPFSVRLLPALFACLSPAVLYFFAKRNFTTRVAIASSLLLTFSDLLLYYAHDCRVYSLFVLLSLTSFYYYFEVIDAKRTTILKQFLFVLFSTLLIYAHYFGILVLGFQGIHLLFFKRKQFSKIFIHYLLILVLYLPCIFIVITRFGATAKGNWIEPPSGIESLYNMLWTFSNVPVITVICIVILFFALVKVIVNKTYFKLKENSSVILILVWFLIPFLGMLFISYWIPMYLSRYLIFALPAYYILLVLCVENLFKKAIYVNMVLGLLIAGFAFTNKLSPDKKQPIFETMQLIKQNKDSNTLVIFGTDEILPTIAYNYNRAYFAAIQDGKEYHLTDSLLKADDVYFTYNIEEIKPLISKFNKVIYIGLDEKTNAANYPIVSELNASYSLIKQDKLGDGRWQMHFYNLRKP